MLLDPGVFGPLGAKDQLHDVVTETTSFNMSVWSGQWIKGLSSGGFENLELNPQFQLVIEETDDDTTKTEATVIISLMQRGRRQMRNIQKTEHTNMGISFRVYQVKEDSQKSEKILSRYFMDELEEIYRIQKFSHVEESGKSEISFEREVAVRLPLPKGHFVIISIPGIQGNEGEFLLRVLTESQSNKVVPADVTTKASRKVEGRDDARVKELFDQYAGEDDVIDASELQKILKVVMLRDFGFMETFSIESCRTLLQIMDTDRSFRIEYAELRKIWGLLTLCRTAFMCFDKNRNGKIEAFELPHCLRMLDMEISGRVMEKLVERFSDKNRDLNFEAFVLSMAKIHELVRMYEEETLYEAEPTVAIDEFMQYQLEAAGGRRLLPYYKRDVQKRTVYL